jgi:hypothetical protein
MTGVITYGAMLLGGAGLSGLQLSLECKRALAPDVKSQRMTSAAEAVFKFESKMQR